MTWEVINKTTHSGKQLYKCTECGWEDPAPTKNHECSFWYQGVRYTPADDKIVPLLCAYFIFGSKSSRQFEEVFYEAVKYGRLVPQEKDNGQ